LFLLLRHSVTEENADEVGLAVGMGTTVNRLLSGATTNVSLENAGQNA